METPNDECSSLDKVHNWAMFPLYLWEKFDWMKKEESSFSNEFWVCLNAKYFSLEKCEKNMLVDLNLYIDFAGNQDDISIKVSGGIDTIVVRQINIKKGNKVGEEKCLSIDVRRYYGWGCDQSKVWNYELEKVLWWVGLMIE